MSKGNVYIGTSGWQYSHWRGNFYPELKRGTSSAYPKYLPQKDWLKYYSQHFDTVEVNSSFYRQTKLETFEKWLSEVPKDFVFSVKGNRYITHIKRLKNCEEPVKIFFENLKPLHAPSYKPSTRAQAEGLPATPVVLWQLPPSLKKDIQRLKDFLRLLSETGNLFRHAFEFRHESWLDKEVITSMIRINEMQATIVFQDWEDWPGTADYTDLIGLHGLKKLPFIYIRFHGREQLYTSGYSDEELAKWSEKMRKWISRGLDVYAYFNNDALGNAVENAMTLKKLIL